MLALKGLPEPIDDRRPLPPGLTLLWKRGLPRADATTGLPRPESGELL